ncbi:MAG: S26 family signal peptidase [Verrucomicrobiota bacterium]
MKPEAAESIAKELQLLEAPRTDVMFHGLSMEPLLAEADRVIVEPVKIEDIEVGDVITYRFEEKFPTRRVAEIRLDYFVLCCDNWPTVYFHAPFTDLLGRVVARKRGDETLTSDDLEWKKQRQRVIRNYRFETSSAISMWIRNRVFQRRRRLNLA